MINFYTFDWSLIKVKELQTASENMLIKPIKNLATWNIIF